jgi:cell division protein FtsL
MINPKFKIFHILIPAIALIAVFSCGAFALMGASNYKREISKEIASCERQIHNLRRTNDELTLKIAEQVNPIRLMKRASSKLIQPNLTENIVWAYENFDGGRVVRSYKKTDNTLSFKMPTRRNR